MIFFYGEWKMLKQIFFYKIVYVWTSIDSILKGFFINFIHNNIIQNPKSKSVKRNYILY
jgi:hypothetical protein